MKEKVLTACALSQCLAALLPWPHEQREQLPEPTEGSLEGASENTPTSPSNVQHVAFATGNWGSGVFGGDAQYKALIQWIAASYSGRNVIYSPFGDSRLDRVYLVVNALQTKNISINEVYKLLLKYETVHTQQVVFDYILESINQEGES